MKKKLENIIKTNTLINKMYTLIGSLVINLVGLFVKQKPKTILFVSYMGKNFNDSPKMIYDELINDEYFEDYTFIWAFNDINKYKIDNKNTKIIKMDSFKYLLTALQAEYWITNVNIERGLHFKKDYTKSINTWHGIPFKKVGNDVQGRNDFDFSNTNLFCYSGEYESEIYKKAFNLTDKNLFKTGMPRNDLVIKNDSKIIDKVHKKYNIKNKKIILYAPTWRENQDDLKLMDLNKWKEELEDKYVFFIKAHGLSEQLNIQNNEFVMDVSNYEETSELLIAADMLITDYSSIFFDYALLGKPIFIYAPDYNKYVYERGAYFNLQETDLEYFENSNSLLNYIKQFNYEEESMKSSNFIKKYNDTRNTNSTNTIVKLMKEGKL